MATPRNTNSEGKFAFYLDPGTYKFQAQADEENAGGGRTVGGLTPEGGPCIVTDTATVIVCNITLASYNTKIKLLGEGGTAYRFANISFNVSPAAVRMAKARVLSRLRELMGDDAHEIS